MKKPTESAAFLGRKRTKAVYKARHKLKGGAQSANAAELSAIAHVKVERAGRSSLLGFLGDAHSPTVSSLARDVRIQLPQDFTIVDNPTGCLAVFRRLAMCSRSNRLRRIHIDHSAVTKIDLCAESVLDRFVKEIEHDARLKRKRLSLSGTLPSDPDIDMYVRATGIIKHLQIKKAYLDPKDEGKLRILRVHSLGAGDEVGLYEMSKEESAVKKLIDYINECLGESGRTMTPNGEEALAAYAGEILNNVVEHSGRRDWSVVGYLNPEDPMHICELAVFNFGGSIADSFRNVDKQSLVRRKVDAYTRSHERMGKWKRDNLVTVVALQQYISSKLSEEQPDRGQGTVQLIDFFMDVHEECTGQSKDAMKMALCSGSTHILFDGTYRMEDDGTGRRVIAFNEQNDLRRPPDGHCVTNLQGFPFPGTAIMVKFPIQPSKIQEVTRYDGR